MRSLVVSILLFASLMWCSAFCGDEAFHEFFQQKDIDEVFTFIQNRIKPALHVGIKNSPSKVFWNDYGNHLEKLNLFSSVLKKRNIIFRWRKMVLQDADQVERFKGVYPGQQDEYFILEIKHESRWKPVDMFFSNDFFEFKYYGKKDKFFFKLPEKYFWSAERKIFISSQRFFKDLLNLKETHLEQLVISDVKKRAADSMDDFCKISFIRNELFNGKMIVSKCSEAGNEVLEIDHYYVEKPFREVQSTEVQKICFELTLTGPESSGEKVEKKYSLSDDINSGDSYTFFWISKYGENREKTDLKRYEDILARLKVLGFLKQLDSSLIEVKSLINSVHSLSLPVIRNWVIPFFENYIPYHNRIFQFLPVVVKESVNKSKNMVSLYFWREFIYSKDADSLMLSLMDVFLKGRVNTDSGISVYFLQDLLTDLSDRIGKVPEVLEKIMNGCLVVLFNHGGSLYIQPGGDYRARELEEKESFVHYFDYDLAPSSSFVDQTVFQAKNYTGEKLPGIELQVDTEGKLKKTGALKKMILEKSFEKILSGIQYEKKFSSFYKMQKYGYFHSLVGKDSCYYPGREKEYLKNLAEFYRFYK